MRTITKILPLVLLFFSINIFSQSGWVQQNSGVTTNLDDIRAVNSTTAYAFNPLFRTTNGGAVWTSIPAPAFVSMSWPDALTGYGCNGTAYKSTDGGSTWVDQMQTSISLLSFPNTVTGYGMCYSEFDTVREETNYRIKKTTNGGTSWQTALQYMSTNTANTWYNFFAMQAPGAQVVYLSFIHWDYLGPLGSVHESVFMGTTNGGANWNNIRVSNLITGDTLVYKKFYFPSPDTGYVSAQHVWYPKYYLLRYAGGQWTSTGSFNDEIRCIYFPTNTTGYVVVGAHNIYKTTNSGSAWLAVNPPDTTQINGMHFANTMTGYAVGANGLILKTTTGGETPVFYSVSGTVKYQDNSLPVTSGYVKAIKYDSSSFSIVTVDSVQIQPNGSYSFTHIPPAVIDIMAYENDEEEMSFVPTYYVSTINWQNAANIHVDSNMSNIDISVKRVVNPGNSFHLSGYIYTNNTVDNSTLKDAFIYSRLAGIFKGHSVSLSNGYYCIDSLPPGVYELIVDRMGYQPANYILSITNSSIENVNFYLDNALVSVPHNGSLIPDKICLNQNYPNPFNPKTIISFQIEKSSFANLTVYDILGKSVITLVNEELNPGYYETEFDGTYLASGLYFYRLEVYQAGSETGEFIETKKLVLLK